MHTEQGSRKEQPWRSELEIEMARQEELARHLAITPDIKQGVYPFRGMKLSRADVEWLVATHENAQSSQASSDEQQQHPQGLDLRGADLRYVDLHAFRSRVCAVASPAKSGKMPLKNNALPRQFCSREPT